MNQFEPEDPLPPAAGQFDVFETNPAAWQPPDQPEVRPSPPEPAPRLLTLTIAGATVSLENQGRTETASFELPPADKINRAQALMVKARLDNAESKKLLELGQLFYAHLLPSPLDQIFEGARQTSPALQLHLNITDPYIQTVPWEYLANRQGFLATRPNFALTRQSETVPAWSTEVDLALPLRLLIAVSSPLDLEPRYQLDADREVTLIRRGIRQALEAGKIELELEDQLSIDQLRASLDQFKPHLLHFTGHGYVEVDKEGAVRESGLLLEDAEGNQRRVSGSELARVLAGRPELRAVVLSACVTALPRTGEAITSTAAELLAEGIHVVIAMQESIRDDSAIRLAQFFYPALAEGKTPAQALAIARQRLSELAGTEGKASDWGMPVLLTSQPERQPFRFNQSGRPRRRAVLSGSNLTVARSAEAFFVGRQAEQRAVRAALTGDKEKLMIIWGLGGFGKSTLAQRMVARTTTHFRLVHTISCKSTLLPDGSQLPFDLLGRGISGLADALAGLGVDRLKAMLEDKQRQFTSAELGQAAGQSLNRLPALLVLDNFEDLLDWQRQNPPEETQQLNPLNPAMAEWLEAFLLHLEAGRVLVTSRYDFQFTRTHRHQQAIGRVNLNRLGLVEALRLMAEYPALKLLPLDTLVELYGKGLDNPQLIELAATHQDKVGNLTGEAGLMDVHGNYSKDMLFEKLYEALPIPAQALLRRMAVYRQAVPLEFLSRQQPGAKNYIQILLDYSLVNRDVLIESGSRPLQVYNQHQSVRYFGLERLEAEEKAAGVVQAYRRAATHYEYYANRISHKLSDCIEAKNHYLAAGQLKEAVRLIRELNPVLDRQGYWREALQLNRELNWLWQKSVDTTDPSQFTELDVLDRIDLLNNEADKMRKLGQVKEAIYVYEQVLGLAKQTNHQQGEEIILANLGLAYSDLADYFKAISYYEQSLSIAKEIGDLHGEGSIYGSLGNIYYSMGSYSKAVQYQLQHLDIAQQLNDQLGEGTAYSSLGNAYFRQGNYPKSIEYHLQSLSIAQQIGDLYGEGTAYSNLGNVLANIGQYSKAISYYKQSLDIAQQIGDLHAEGSIYGSLGNVYFIQEDYTNAIQQYEQTLIITQQTGNRQNEGNVYGNLGNAYYELGDYHKAIQYQFQHLDIAQQIGDQLGEGNVYGNLGKIYCSLGDYTKAIQYQLQHLNITQQMGNRQGEGIAHGNLGNVFSSLGDYSKAISHYEQSLSIAQQIGDRLNESIGYSSLGNAYLRQEIYPKSIEYYRQYLTITQQMGNRQGEGVAYGSLGIAYAGLGEYKQAITDLVRANLLLSTIQNPNIPVVLSNLRQVRRAVGQSQFEEWITQTCQELGVEYTIYRPSLEQAGVFSDGPVLKPAFKTWAYTFAQAALGSAQALHSTQQWLNEIGAEKNWQKLAGIVKQILAGERQDETLVSKENGLNESARAIVELTLAAIADPQKLSSLETEILAAQSIEGETDSAGWGGNQLNKGQQQVGMALDLALAGNFQARQTLESQVLPVMEGEGSQYKALARVIRQLLAGELSLEAVNELNEESGLDAVDRAILQLSLAVMKQAASGTASSASVPSSPPAPPQPDQQLVNAENQAEVMLALLVAAAQGKPSARTHATQLLDELQENRETRRLAMMLERLIVEGERDRTVLTRGLDQESASLITKVLDTLEKED